MIVATEQTRASLNLALAQPFCFSKFSESFANSRVENGHATPSIETLQKYARALEIPIYRLFYDGDHPQSPTFSPTKNDKTEWGAKGKEYDELRRFAKVLSQLDYGGSKEKGVKRQKRLTHTSGAVPTCIGNGSGEDKTNIWSMLTSQQNRSALFLD